MTVVVGIYAAACAVLVIAGTAKTVDPGPSSGALRALGWPVPIGAVRVTAMVETLLGVVGLLWSSPVVAGLVGVSYLGFAAFIVVALRTGTPLSTCGCLGRVDTQPSVGHVVADLLAATGSVVVAVSGSRGFVDELDHHALVVVWTAVFVAVGLLALTGRFAVARR